MRTDAPDPAGPTRADAVSFHAVDGWRGLGALAIAIVRFSVAAVLLVADAAYRRSEVPGPTFFGGLAQRVDKLTGLRPRATIAVAPAEPTS